MFIDLYMADAGLGFCQRFMLELFWENSWKAKAINYFPPQKVHLNIPQGPKCHYVWWKHVTIGSQCYLQGWKLLGFAANCLSALTKNCAYYVLLYLSILLIYYVITIVSKANINVRKVSYNCNYYNK